MDAMIQAVIFDCFGVLVGNGFWHVYESLGGDLTKDGAYVNAELEKAELKHISSQEFSERMATKLGISVAAYRAAFERERQLVSIIHRQMGEIQLLHDSELAHAASSPVITPEPASKGWFRRS